MGRSVPLMLAIAALLVLFIWCALDHAPEIEARLAKRAEHALSTPSLPDLATAEDERRIRVEMDGRVATLTGSLTNEAERDEVLRRVAAVAGIQRVRDELRIARTSGDSRPADVVTSSDSAEDPDTRPSLQAEEPAEPPAPEEAASTDTALSLLLADDGLTLRGTLPSEAHRRDVVARASAMVGASRLRDELVVAEPAPGADDTPGAAIATSDRAETFSQTVSGLLEALEAGPADSRLDWRGDTVTVYGSVPSRAAADRFLQVAGRKAAPIEVLDRLTVVPPAPAEQVQARVEAVLRTGSIRFRTGSARLSPEGEQVLAAIARELQASPALEISIEGHTDSTGDAASNLSLSRRRAQAVRAFLVGRNVEEARMQTEGFGESRPIADNTSSAGRQANRRIEFRVSEGGGN